jgi:hypothetical protein
VNRKALAEAAVLVFFVAVTILNALTLTLTYKAETGTQALLKGFHDQSSATLKQQAKGEKALPGILTELSNKIATQDIRAINRATLQIEQYFAAHPVVFVPTTAARQSTPSRPAATVPATTTTTTPRSVATSPPPAASPASTTTSAPPTTTAAPPTTTVPAPPTTTVPLTSPGNSSLCSVKLPIKLPPCR